MQLIDNIELHHIINVLSAEYVNWMELYNEGEHNIFKAKRANKLFKEIEEKWRKLTAHMDNARLRIHLQEQAIKEADFLYRFKNLHKKT